MSESATEVWSQIKDKYWDREWDVDEMLADDESSHEQSVPTADD
ncbi:hypothetical protein [Halorussus pelagicus]|nr:hypothetical protein [Halorussus pelagicus]